MFTTFANTAIDAVQTSKKMVVDTLVKHEGLATALNKFVDSQTQYTKNAVATGYEVATSIAGIVSTKSFYEEMIASSQEFAKSVMPNSKKGK